MTARSAVLAALQSQGQALDQPRRICGIRAEGLGQIASQHVESGQFLAHAVVQVLADASLLQRGDFHDLALQFPSLGNVLVGNNNPAGTIPGKGCHSHDEPTLLLGVVARILHDKLGHLPCQNGSNTLGHGRALLRQIARRFASQTLK